MVKIGNPITNAIPTEARIIGHVSLTSWNHSSQLLKLFYLKFYFTQYG